MFGKNKWPFVPLRLTEIIDKEMLAVIEAGCCERLGRSMTILDGGNPDEHIGRINSINPWQKFEPFCRRFRDESRVSGGNAACEQCDIRAARASLRNKRKDFRSFRCHLGLYDATHLIKVRGWPVAILFAGQSRPSDGVDCILQNVQELGSGHYQHIQLLDTQIQTELYTLAENLSETPEDLSTRLKREAVHIQKIAEAEYQRSKHHREQTFLDTLREFGGSNESIKAQQIRFCVKKLLKYIQRFCHCEYLVFFASRQEHDTVLAPIGHIGIPSEISQNLPHFNWKKAHLPLDSVGVKQWSLTTNNEFVSKGVRGDNSKFFADLSSIVPVIWGGRYRGVLLFGPFSESVDLKQEQRFLREIGNIVGEFTLTRLQLRYEETKRRQWQSTALLLTHQLRTALTPITTRIGRAKLLCNKIADNADKIVSSLQRTEDLCLQLSKGAQKTLKGVTVLVEVDDLTFEPYPLSVLVANCIEGFRPKAKKLKRQILIDKSIEWLPEAEIDVDRLVIALSNLVDNALKYSYPNTEIRMYSSLEMLEDPSLSRAVIRIDNLGDGIQTKDIDRIFERGVRGLIGAKLGRIPGTGLGLWETKAVIEAHGGTIKATSEPTSIERRHGRVHHVIFTLSLPLNQPSRKVRRV